MAPTETHQQTLQEVVRVQVSQQALDKVETSDITEPMKKNFDAISLSEGAPTATERARELADEMNEAAKNFKTSPRVLTFNLKGSDHRAALVGLISECQNQGVHFELRQDGLVTFLEF